MMNATTIHKLLGEIPGRYLERTDTLWLMKEANGDPVTVVENGEEYPVIAQFIWLDDLTLQGRLTKDGRRYVVRHADRGASTNSTGDAASAWRA